MTKHITIKLLKASNLEKNLKSIQEKKKDTLHLKEQKRKMQSRTQWRNIFKVLKEKSINKLNSIPVKCSLVTMELS